MLAIDVWVKKLEKRKRKKRKTTHWSRQPIFKDYEIKLHLQKMENLLQYEVEKYIEYLGWLSTNFI
jgi:hypothetical protein